jgi:hypothetical protein
MSWTLVRVKLSQRCQSSRSIVPRVHERARRLKERVMRGIVKRQDIRAYILPLLRILRRDSWLMTGYGTVSGSWRYPRPRSPQQIIGRILAKVGVECANWTLHVRGDMVWEALDTDLLPLLSFLLSWCQGRTNRAVYPGNRRVLGLRCTAAVIFFIGCSCRCSLLFLL